MDLALHLLTQGATITSEGRDFLKGNTGCPVEYKLNEARMTWQEHEDAATAWGGHLASIKSQEEMDLVWSMGHHDTWLGAERISSNGPGAEYWKWTDGEAWTYTNWNPGEPNNSGGGEDRVQTTGGRGGGGWNDIGRGSSQKGVYKKILKFGSVRLEQIYVGHHISRTKAQKLCEERGGRLAYRRELVDEGTKAGNGTMRLRVNDGNAYGGEKWIPVLDGDPSNNNLGEGWVQVGDNNRLGKNHREAHGGDCGWGDEGNGGGHKGPWIWCCLVSPVAQLARSNAPASAQLLEALASKAPEFIFPLWIGALADDPSKTAAMLEVCERNSEITLDDATLAPLLENDAALLKGLLRAKPDEAEARVALVSKLCTQSDAVHAAVVSPDVFSAVAKPDTADTAWLLFEARLVPVEEESVAPLVKKASSTFGHHDEDLNPPEASRSYSSVYVNNAIGTGHARSTLGSEQAWSAQHNNHDQWMVIDTGKQTFVFGVIVQGRGRSAQGQKVTRVAVSVGNARDGPWTECGEYDCHTSNEHEQRRVMLKQPTAGRYVRLNPRSWEHDISMRAGVIISQPRSPLAHFAWSRAPASAKLLQVLASKAPQLIVPLWIGALVDDPSKTAATLEALCAHAEIKDAALLAALMPKTLPPIQRSGKAQRILVNRAARRFSRRLLAAAWRSWVLMNAHTAREVWSAPAHTVINSL